MPISLLPPRTPLGEAQDALDDVVWNAVEEADLDGCGQMYDYLHGNDPEMGELIRRAFLATTTAAAFEDALADTTDGRLVVNPAVLWLEVTDLATQILQVVLASASDELAVIERLSTPPVLGRKELIKRLWRNVIDTVFERLTARDGARSHG